MPSARIQCRKLTRGGLPLQAGNAPDEVVPDRTYAVFEFIGGGLHGYLAAVAKFGQARPKRTRYGFCDASRFCKCACVSP